MAGRVLYRQVNKDHAYWTEKRAVGHVKGGHTSGLLTYVSEDGAVAENILIDAGLGTMEGLADLADFSWEAPLKILITHSHIDHHAELLILSEMWCNRMAPGGRRRGPVDVYCTGDPTTSTLKRLINDHKHGFTKGSTLAHVPVMPGAPMPVGSIFTFTIQAIENDHTTGAVNFVVEFGNEKRHKVIIGWDMKTPPSLSEYPLLTKPSLALIEANTVTSVVPSHTSVEDLLRTSFLANLCAVRNPAEQRYGVYLVHYGGREDSFGVLTDADLLAEIYRRSPSLMGLVRVASRGQTWTFAV